MTQKVKTRLKWGPMLLGKIMGCGSPFRKVRGSFAQIPALQKIRPIAKKVQWF